MGHALHVQIDGVFQHFFHLVGGACIPFRQLFARDFGGNTTWRSTRCTDRRHVRAHIHRSLLAKGYVWGRSPHKMGAGRLDVAKQGIGIDKRTFIQSRRGIVFDPYTAGTYIIRMFGDVLGNGHVRVFVFHLRRDGQYRIFSVAHRFLPLDQGMGQFQRLVARTSVFLHQVFG